MAHTHAMPLLSKNNSSPCLDFLSNLTNSTIPPANRSVEANNTYLYSGHNLNDLGDFHTCTKLKTQKYNVMNVKAMGASTTVGFCGPSYCSTAQLQNYSDVTLQVIGNMTRQDMSQYHVTFVDPLDVTIEKGFSFYFTVVLFSIMGFLILVGTVVTNLRKNPRISQILNKKGKSSVSRNVREALLANKDSTGEAVSNETVNKYLDKKTAQLVEVEQGRERRAPFFLRFLQCFDIVENFQDLLKNEIVPGHDQNLNVFNGIRTAAFAWVVYGHVFLLNANAKNYAFASIFLKSTWILLVIGAFYAVDAFFYMSGFLTGFIMLAKLRKMRFGIGSYAQIMIHRLLRLWPTYFIAILFYWKISVYLGSGPLWWNLVDTAQLCTGQAWKNFLLLDNVLTKEFSEYCFGWGWYLACDLQVFFVAPFLCWIYIKNKERCQNVVWILMTISIVTSYVYSADSDFTFLLLALEKGQNTGEYMSQYYINPMVRMSPYLVGLWLGFMFKEWKEGEKNLFSWLKASQKRSILCCLGGTALLGFILFYPRVLQTGDTWTNGFALTWSTFARPLFGIALFMITAPCLVGNMPNLTRAMSNYYFLIVARISYAGYLVHLIVLQIVIYGQTQFYGLNQSYQAGMAIALFLAACVAAIALHLFVEKPMTNLEGILLGGGGKRKRPAKGNEVAPQDGGKVEASKLQ